MATYYWTQLSILLALIWMACAQTWDPCPIGCQCSQFYKKVECKAVGMTQIPRQLPAYTQILIISDANFTSLQRQNFSDFLFLRSLKKLELNNCSIETIESNTFADLPFLESLKVNHNKIEKIDFLEYVKSYEIQLDFNPLQSINFSSYPNLKHVKVLHLNNIGLKSVNRSDLITLRNLEKLYMSNNDIGIVDGYIFSHMTQLKSLSLHNNSIQTLPENFLPVFENLLEIFLDFNPLHCNCELGWFKDFYKRSVTKSDLLGISTQRRLIQATCFTPVFGEISSIDKDILFRCSEPHIIQMTESITIGTDHEAVLSCIAQGDPNPTIIWESPDGDSDITQPSQNKSILHNLGIWTIARMPHQKRGHFKCIADNIAGNITSSVFIDVVNKGPAYTGGDIAAAIFITLFITLIICAILLFLFLRYRNITLWPCQRERDPEADEKREFKPVRREFSPGAKPFNNTDNYSPPEDDKNENDYVDNERSALMSTGDIPEKNDDKLSRDDTLPLRGGTNNNDTVISPTTRPDSGTYEIVQPSAPTMSSTPRGTQPLAPNSNDPEASSYEIPVSSRRHKPTTQPKDETLL